MKNTLIIITALLSLNVFGQPTFSDGGGGGGTGTNTAAVGGMINDSLDALKNSAVVGLAISDSDMYVTQSQYQILVGLIESLGADLTPPAFVSAELGTYNDTIVSIVLNATDVDQASVPSISDFVITQGGTAIGLNAVSLDDERVLISLDSTLTAGTTLLLDYTAGTNPLQDSLGNRVVNWVDSTITNNLGSAPTNMIANGTFNSETYWTLGANWTIAGGVATFDDVAGQSLSQDGSDMTESLATNTDYTLTFDVTITSGNARMTFGNFAQDVTYIAVNNYAGGSHSINFTTPADVSGGGFRVAGSTGSDNAFSIDNITITIR